MTCFSRIREKKGCLGRRVGVEERFRRQVRRTLLKQGLSPLIYLSSIVNDDTSLSKTSVSIIVLAGYNKILVNTNPGRRLTPSLEHSIMLSCVGNILCC